MVRKRGLTMSLWKRGKQYWIDTVVHGERHREPLGTTDWREARALEKKRIVELQQRPPDPTKRARKYSNLTVATAIDQYASERRSQVSPRMVTWWKEMGRPLAAFFGDTPLRKISPADLTAYQNTRRDLGRAPKTVNSELSVLRQLLKHAKLWYRYSEDYKALKNTKPPAGQAIADQEQARLFDVAKSNPAWFFAYVAATLDFFCGLRACEIKALQWKHISWEERRLAVRRSKTPAGWRDPSLNDTCLEALRELHQRAEPLGFTNSEHFLFPWHGLRKQLDPTRPMTSWRTAWRSLRKAAGLPSVRFHDGRHTALTRLAEKGVPDWVIRAQFGHVSPAMMAVYSHVRRKALDEAAKALEPDTTTTPANSELEKTADQDRRVASHVTSQQPPRRDNVIEFPKESGAPCTTRTCDLLVRSQTLYPAELRARRGN
jgi:integrase